MKTLLIWTLALLLTACQLESIPAAGVRDARLWLDATYGEFTSAWLEVFLTPADHDTDSDADTLFEQLISALETDPAFREINNHIAADGMVAWVNSPKQTALLQALSDDGLSVYYAAAKAMAELYNGKELSS